MALNTGRQTIPTVPVKLVSYLEWCEVDSARAPDCRRILRNERFSLLAALRSGNTARIATVRDESVRVAKMWQGF